MKKILVLLALVAFASACAATPITLNRNARKVISFRADPPSGAEELGLVTAKHGGGCGTFGEKGTREGAYALLKNKAYARDATHVRIDREFEPGIRSNPNCMEMDYTIKGTLYRVEEEDEL